MMMEMVDRWCVEVREAMANCREALEWCVAKKGLGGGELGGGGASSELEEEFLRCLKHGSQGFGEWEARRSKIWLKCSMNLGVEALHV